VRRGEARRAQLALPRGECPLTPVLGRRRETTGYGRRPARRGGGPGRRGAPGTRARVDAPLFAEDTASRCVLDPVGELAKT